MIKKTLGILGICSLFPTLTYADNDNLQAHKKVVFVQLDTNLQKSRVQLDLLKNMDVLGVNRKTHEAEVFVTEDEINTLKSAHLSVFSKVGRTAELTAPVNGYLNPTQVREALTALNQQYPHITNTFELGKTHLNLPIMAIELSSQPGDPKRPVILFNGTQHAREVMTTEVVMHIANVLTEQYGKDPEITNWLNQYRIILVPQVNPDGNTFVHQGNTMWRKNAYKIMGTTVGVDLNRNYPAFWNYCSGSSGVPSSETYRGPSAGSEPEVQAMVNLVATTKPVAGISYHSYSEMIMYPYSCSNVPNPSTNLFRKIALNMKAAVRDDANQLNTYVVGTAPDILYSTDGSDDDWQWKTHGVMAYTIEVNASTFRPDYNKWRDVTVKRQEGSWKTLIRQMQSSGFHGFIQSDAVNEVTYSIQKSLSGYLVAFDADDTQKKLTLKSQEGLFYQLTEPGEYQINFYKGDNLVKTLAVNVKNENFDLGTVVLD